MTRPVGRKFRWPNGADSSVQLATSATRLPALTMDREAAAGVRCPVSLYAPLVARVPCHVANACPALFDATSTRSAAEATQPAPLHLLKHDAEI